MYERNYENYAQRSKEIDELDSFNKDFKFMNNPLTEDGFTFKVNIPVDDDDDTKPLPLIKTENEDLDIIQNNLASAFNFNEEYESIISKTNELEKKDKEHLRVR